MTDSDRTSGSGDRESGSSPGHGGSHSGTVRRKALELLLARCLDFRAVPGGGAGGAGLHDERDAVPETADVGAADLEGGAEEVFHARPVLSEVLEDRAAVRSVEESGDAGGLRARRAAGDGERKAALGRIKVGVLGKGELKLVPEGSTGARIVQGAGGILFAGLLKLSTLCGLEVRACV